MYLSKCVSCALFAVLPSLVISVGTWLQYQPISVLSKPSWEQSFTGMRTVIECASRCAPDSCFGYVWGMEPKICAALEVHPGEPILLGPTRKSNQTWLKNGQVKKIHSMILLDNMNSRSLDYSPSHLANSTALNIPNFLESEAFPVHQSFEWGILMCAVYSQVCKKWVYGANEWVDAPSMLVRHEVTNDYNHAGIINNNFWVIGGFGKGRRSSHTEYFTPDGQWVLGPDLPHTLNMFGVAPISDSQVLIAGGSKSGAWSNRIRIFDLFNGTWFTAGTFPQQITNLACAKHSLHNGKAVVICSGGRCRSSTCGSPIDALGDTGVYDIDSGTWNMTVEWDLPVKCVGPRMRVLNGRLFIMGGKFEDGKNERVLEFMEGETSVWQERESLPWTDDDDHVISVESLTWQPY